MKVYFVYDGKDEQGAVVQPLDEQFKVKVDLPTSWLDGPCERVLQFFVKTLKSKRAALTFADEDVMLKCGGVLLGAKDLVAQHIHEYNDLYLVHKAQPTHATARDGEILCTNFGCGMYFKEEENSESSCHYHAKGPVFHDLEKHWACCPEKKAFDWETFRAIPTCMLGRHDTRNKKFEPPREEIQNQPLTAAQMAQGDAPQPGGLGEDGNVRRTTGPREFEGAAHAQTQPQTIVDGKARCRNFGCTKEFVVADNTDTSCHYHKEGPVFWDTYKYWKCCPEKKCLEFDDFVKIPGCTVGAHRL